MGDFQASANVLLAGVAGYLHQQRLQRGWTQHVVGQRSGVSESALSRIELFNRVPTLPTYIHLCFALDLSPGTTLRKVEEMTLVSGAASRDIAETSPATTTVPIPVISSVPSGLLVDQRDESAFAHAVGALLEITRRKRGLTLEDLDERCGINARYLSEMERAKRPLDMDTFAAWCHGLQVSPADIVAAAVKEAYPPGHA